MNTVTAHRHNGSWWWSLRDRQAIEACLLPVLTSHGRWQLPYDHAVVTSSTLATQPPQLPVVVGSLWCVSESSPGPGLSGSSPPPLPNQEAQVHLWQPEHHWPGQHSESGSSSCEFSHRIPGRSFGIASQPASEAASARCLSATWQCLRLQVRLPVGT